MAVKAPTDLCNILRTPKNKKSKINFQGILLFIYLFHSKVKKSKKERNLSFFLPFNPPHSAIEGRRGRYPWWWVTFIWRGNASSPFRLLWTSTERQNSFFKKNWETERFLGFSSFFGWVFGDFETRSIIWA